MTPAPNPTAPQEDDWEAVADSLAWALLAATDEHARVGDAGDVALRRYDAAKAAARDGAPR